jgi:hypothetical protein
MEESNVPEMPKDSFRMVLQTTAARSRLDQVLLEALRAQNRNLQLRVISRMKLKALFNDRKVKIKGQRAVASSGLAKGTTYVDIYGFGEDTTPGISD